jgi:hypothetical protein
LRSYDRYVSIKFPQNLVSTHAPTSEQEFWPPALTSRPNANAPAQTLDDEQRSSAANKQQTNSAAMLISFRANNKT